MPIINLEIDELIGEYNNLLIGWNEKSVLFRLRIIIR
jgi:hypothetical protein